MIGLTSIIMALVVPMFVVVLAVQGRLLVMWALLTSSLPLFVMTSLCVGFAISGWVLIYLQVWRDEPAPKS